MAFLTAMSNSFGARWFDENWQSELNGEEWMAAVDLYMALMNNYGPPGASTNGFNESLSLFQQGKCGMWIDATVAASFVTNPEDSTVADKVGFALAPDDGLGRRGNWLWAWFDHYIRFVTYSAFWPSVSATLIVVGGVLITTVVFGVLLAILLNQPMRRQGIVRILVIAPFFVMPTV